MRELPPPEALTAGDCLRLWESFRRTLERLPPPRWALAGKALLDDLEVIGQRLEIMPLVGWERLPEALDTGAARNDDTPTPTAITTTTVARRKSKARERPASVGSPLERARAMQDRLLELGQSEVGRLLAEAMQAGTLDRSEASLISRWCARASAIAKDDDAVIDALRKLEDIGIVL